MALDVFMALDMDEEGGKDPLDELFTSNCPHEKIKTVATVRRNASFYRFAMKATSTTALRLYSTCMN